MAKPRVYRDDMQRPRCGSNWLPKYGRSRGEQTYRCGKCGCHFTAAAKHPHHPETRQLAGAIRHRRAEGLGVSALRLYVRLPEAERYRSDHYRVYEWLPMNRHRIGKGSEVNRNEGVHSQLRDRLRRLQRRAKGYTKSPAMLTGSVAWACLELGLI